VVGIGWHDVGHLPQPFPALQRTGDGLAAGFVLYRDMGKELATGIIKSEMN